jgi:hypothetical protein
MIVVGEQAVEVQLAFLHHQWPATGVAFHVQSLRHANANTRHRDVLAAEHRERARIRREKGIRWGGRPLLEAA